MRRLLVLFLLCAPALADSIVQTEEVYATGGDGWDGFFGYTGPIVDQVLTFSLFDSSLGVLDEVIIEFEGTFSGDMFFATDLSDPGGPVTLALSAGVFDPSGIRNHPIGKSYVVSGYSSYGSTGGTTILADPITDLLTVGSGDLAEFVGIGDFTLLAQVDGANPFVGSNFSWQAAGTLTGTYSITYNYTPGAPDPVPEPGTWALCGAALLGYGLFRRRRGA